MADPKKGDDVAWNSHGGKAHGKVVKTLTDDITIKGTTIRASKDDPRLLVETEEGKRAAHKPEALEKE